ncbi:PREDICTED: uncharacterized protein LOC109183638 [Ipomoea nil]|uniref:uncharacterized protein LOC109183638 n=1 Tax=Ipomoea nil TaxID=35883 RepID=UPI000900EBAC|nr:PREDICTED: uncharacterized protein LOC109183638 [Ipomoea nil]
MASVRPTLSDESSERTVSTGPSASPVVAPPTLSSAHHFVSIKLSSKNYLFWRTQMVPFFCRQGLLRFVDGSHECPAVVTSTSDGVISVDNSAVLVWEQQDQAILSMLVASLSEEVMYLIVGYSTSRQVWQAIEGRAKVTVEEFAMAGPPVSLDEQNLYVFRGLRPEFRAMASSLVTSSNSVTISQLSDFLLAQQFIYSDDFSSAMESQPATMVLQRGGGRRSGSGGSGHGGR